MGYAFGVLCNCGGGKYFSLETPQPLPRISHGEGDRCLKEKWDISRKKSDLMSMSDLQPYLSSRGTKERGLYPV